MLQGTLCCMSPLKAVAQHCVQQVTSCARDRATSHLQWIPVLTISVWATQVAGAAAAAGASLEEVKAEAEAVISGVGTVGMATDICRLPGAPVRER